MADSEKSPTFLSKWEATVNENFNSYQEQINKVTYGLQRGQAGFLGMGSHFYPYFYQTKFLRLELLQKKQLLGKIETSEIEHWEEATDNRPTWRSTFRFRGTPNIRESLSNTFNSNWFIPMRGLYYGLVVFTGMSYFNANMTLRINTFVVCALWDWTSHRFNRAHPVNSLNFMNWTLAVRTAKARMEIGQ
jgi:hypothetical protein